MPAFGLEQILGAMGQQDPYDELKAYSARRRAQDAQAVDPTNATGENPAGATAAVQAANTVPQPQVANAYKTPPDMGSILVDLQRRKEAQQGWDSAIGMGVSAFAQPGNRARVAGMFKTDYGDPIELGKAIMDAGSQEQGQLRANTIAAMVNSPQTGPNIAKAFNMDWEQLKIGIRTDPGLLGRIAEAYGKPNADMATLAQLGHMPGAGAGSAGGALGDLRTQTISKLGGNPEMEQAQLAWDKKNPGQPTPWGRNDLADFQRYTKNQQERQDSAAEFGKNHGLNIDKVTDFQHHVEDLKNSPGMAKIMQSPNAYRSLIKLGLEHPDWEWTKVAESVPEWAGKWVSIDSDVKAALAEIRQLKSENYANAMKSIGQRFTGQEVQNVSKGMDQLGNLELDPQNYQDQLDDLVDRTKTIRANSHGSAQDFSGMDPDLETYVNPIFTKGGKRNVEDSGSEDWADKVKMSPEEIDAAKKLIKAGSEGTLNPDTGKPWTRRDVERMFRKEGKRPNF